MAQVTYDEIKKAFQETVDSDKECIKLYKEIRAGDASYASFPIADNSVSLSFSSPL